MKNISTNIVRDSGKKLDFIATPNSKEVFERIFLEEGTKSFNLIGNYGTGKSTFLWACEQVLIDQVNLFGLDNIKTFDQDFEILKIVGEEESLLRLFAIELSLAGRVNTKRVIETLEAKIQSGKRVVVFIDEFGKVLEYIAKSNQTTDLYLLQQIAEWVNGFENQAYLVTTLHQNFSSYSEGTSTSQQQEWEKVKGRYRDIVFNEPVEQLLFFASKELKLFEPSKDQIKKLDELLDLVNSSKLVSFNTILITVIVEELYPLDWLSANILVQALQKYGQNERSLFTFVNETSRVSIRKNTESIYSVAKVYDYIVNSLPTEINNPNNSHRAQWLTAFRALERAELFFEENYELATRVIKTILLTNLFSKSGGLLDDKFLINYFKKTEGNDVTDVLDGLNKSGIIRFYSYSNKINFLEGTDIDIEQELIEAGKEIPSNLNYPRLLQQYALLDVVYAKRHSFEKGTKRFFEFKVLESLDELKESSEGVDGYINIISFSCKEEELIKASKAYPDNGFVALAETSDIELWINKLIKYDLLIEKHSDDKNAVKLLTQERQYALELLEYATSRDLYDSSNRWFFNGEKREISSSRDLYATISWVCDTIYYKTPHFDNELINRNVLSSPIVTARRALLDQLITKNTEIDLGYPEDKFPPDKAIYISLIRETGLHRFDKERKIYNLVEPEKGSTFAELWADCNEFLRSALTSKRKVSELYDLLASRPYKLKKGFIDFFIPVFMIVKEQDYALFYQDSNFVPFLSLDNIDLIHKKAEDFSIKAYNVEGLNINLLESYKELVGITGSRPTQATFLGIYSNFLRFIRSLDEYTLNTDNISPAAKELRNAIQRSSDPETALFNTIPVALGYGDILDNPSEEKLTLYTLEIQKAIKELRGSYSELLNRIEGYLIEAFGLRKNDMISYKAELREKILDTIESNKLAKDQAILYKRLTSALDDRETYLKSVADAILGYPVETMKDFSESVLKEQLKIYAKGLIMASSAQKFNKNNTDRKLIHFYGYDEDGTLRNYKTEIDSLQQNAEYIEKINQALNGVDLIKKREVIMQMLLLEIPADQYEQD
jgi:hypothetical protein